MFGAVGPIRRHWRAIDGVVRRRRRRLLCRCRLGRRGLREREGWAEQQHAGEKNYGFYPHATKTREGRRGSCRELKISDNGSARNGPSAASAAARPG